MGTAAEPGARRTGRLLQLPQSLLVAACAAGLGLLLLALLAGPLAPLRIPEYTAWHTLLEVASAGMSFLIAVAAWYRAQGRNALVTRAAGFMAVTVLDLAHMATFPGMPDWLGTHSLDQTLVFWFGARLAIALCFLYLLLPARLQPLLAWLYLPYLIAMLLLGLVWREAIPPLYVEGHGLTALKIGLEWGMCVAYFALAAAIWRRGEVFRADLLCAGLVVLGTGELFFTLYMVPDGLASGFGHLYKLLGMALIFRAVVQAQIIAPYEELQHTRLARERVATRLDDLIRGAPDGILVVAVDGTVRSANPPAEQLFGAAPDALAGVSIEQLVPGELRDRHARHRQHYQQAPQVRLMSAATALQAQRLDGGRFYVDVSLSPVEWDGEPTTVAFVRDATTRVEQMLRLDWLAAHDALTGLPNRWALTRELARRCGTGSHCSCVTLDIDNLGRVNDALGHDTGDALLKAMAQRVAQRLRSGDFLARLEGDKFVLVCVDDRCAEGGLPSLLDQLNRPIELDDGLKLDVSVTGGIAHFPDDGQTAEALIQASEIAMVEAKRTQRRGFGSYHPQLQQRGRSWMAVSTRMPSALANNEFRLVYQPRLNLRDGSLAGVEALMRWQGPEGPMSPAEFIPIAEENGFILELGRWSIDAALAQVRRWLDAGIDPGRVGINLSTRQLADVELPRRLRHAMQLHRVDPASIELEVTETAAMENLDWALPRLRALAAEGVTLALDDFGTGYSSLAYLQRLPVNVIKIDISFVQGIGTPNGEALLRSIVGLAHGLGKSLVAEGVETPAQADWLREVHCEEAQGYLLSAPLEHDQLPDFVAGLPCLPSTGMPPP